MLGWDLLFKIPFNDPTVIRQDLRSLNRNSPVVSTLLDSFEVKIHHSQAEKVTNIHLTLSSQRSEDLLN
jgi:hypothetical protein